MQKLVDIRLNGRVLKSVASGWPPSERGGLKIRNGASGWVAIGGKAGDARRWRTGVVIQAVGYNFNDGVSARRLLRIRVARNF